MRKKKFYYERLQAQKNAAAFMTEVKTQIFLSNKITQKSICEELGIAESTFINRVKNNSFSLADCLFLAMRTGVDIEKFKL